MLTFTELTPCRLHASDNDAPPPPPPAQALPLDPEPASAAAGGRGALAGGPPQPAHGSPGWPGGPPLAEMHFDMGWHDPAAGQGRRRRRLCTR